MNLNDIINKEFISVHSLKIWEYITTNNEIITSSFFHGTLMCPVSINNSHAQRQKQMEKDYIYTNKVSWCFMPNTKSIHK